MKWMGWICCVASLAGIAGLCFAEPLLIDHQDTDITTLTQAQVDRAKSVLHIAYGHTSHGSQVTDGMNGLVDFANGGGLGLNLSSNVFDWNNGGSGGALDLEEGVGYGSGWLELDGGYWPTWYNETIEYLNDPAHADVNVMIWSWCGQMDDKYSSGTLTNEYLQPMADLESMYPDVIFVYMTGHAEISDDEDNKAACAVIRDWCSVSNRILYDFNDIEHYDPDGNWFEWVNDDCSLYAYAGGSITGNWAMVWQDSHTEDVDWYSCGSAHSQPLNANQKAYAAWALWCQLAADMDRDSLADAWEEAHGGTHLFAGGTNDYDGDGLTDWQEFVLDHSPTNSAPPFDIEAVVSTNAAMLEFSSSLNRLYSLRVCTDLESGSWSNILSQPGTGGTMSLTDESPAAGVQAYRIAVSVPD
jgi:hypothetical protein